MRTAVPGTTVKPPDPVTVPEPGNEAVAAATGANINREAREAREVTQMRELGMPSPVAATPAPTPTSTSIVTTLLEKKRDYESMRQQAIDELLGVMGNARQQLAELGWEDPEEAQPVFRVPTVRRGRPPGVRPVGRPRTQHVGAEPRVIPGLKNKKCPVCGKKGHDGRSHRMENLKAIAAGKREAKR